MSNSSKHPKTRVFIVGAYGFLGQHVTNYFVHKGYHVHLAVKSSSKAPKAIKDLKLPLSFTDAPDFIDHLDDLMFDIVIYTAVDYGKNKIKDDVWECNVYLPLRIVEKVGNEKLLFIHFDTFFNKFSKYKYLPLYTLSKQDFRDKLKQNINCKIVGLQLEHLYGENDNPTKFISTLINALKSNKDEIQLTSGEQKRDFIYVGDLVDLIDKLILTRENLALDNYLFEVGTGESISLKKFVIELKNQLKASTKLIFDALPMRQNEIMDSKANLDKLDNVLSWRPKINFKQGINKLI